MPDAPPADPSRPSVGAVKDQHRFEIAPLAAWFETHVESLAAPLEVRQFNKGASNPTFLLSAGERRWVLRKKPPGQLLASAHQIEREFRVMRALGAQGFPAPVMRALCEDAGVIGTPFYVMDFLEGRIFRDARLPGLSPAERAAIYDDLNATLARLHGIDPAAAGLADFGRPGDYFQRQIARWTAQYRGAQTEDIADMERLIETLPGAIHADDQVAIAHGDYRLENVMFHPTEPRLIAVLDWGAIDLGPPLADIAYGCILYHSTSESWGTLAGVDLTAAGIPTQDEYVAAYCARTGRTGIADFNAYLAFSMFRLAAIGQGVFKRNLDGIGNADGAVDNDNTKYLAATAWKVLRG